MWPLESSVTEPFYLFHHWNPGISISELKFNGILKVDNIIKGASTISYFYKEQVRPSVYRERSKHVLWSIRRQNSRLNLYFLSCTDISSKI
eukprot:snap_masked-scaffold_6-processed-gene-1.24-mRNA-1 protein AED:1.00 eAED:1.00 QI:0/0/0/0/1/1/2/0/90